MDSNLWSVPVKKTWDASVSWTPDQGGAACSLSFLVSVLLPALRRVFIKVMAAHWARKDFPGWRWAWQALLVAGLLPSVLEDRK